jgi:hypothetical protein
MIADIKYDDMNYFGGNSDFMKIDIEQKLCSKELFDFTKYGCPIKEMVTK